MKHRILLSLFAPLLVLLAACSSLNERPKPASGMLEPDASPVPLYATDGVRVGTVSATDDGTTLTVRYEITEPGWCLVETHLSVSTHAEDLTGLDPSHFTGHDFAPGKGHDFAPGKGHDKHHGDDDDWDEDWDDWGDWDDWDDDRHGDDRPWDDDDHGDDDDNDDENDDGHGDGYDDGYDDGYGDGYDDGYDDGYGDGKGDGHDDGKGEDDGGKEPAAPGDGVTPDPYQFPYQAQHDCVGTYTYEIPLSELGDVGDKLIVAAHALVTGDATGGGSGSGGGGSGGDGGSSQCSTGMYGIERGTGAIYRIDDVPGQVFEQIASFDDSSSDDTVPDGLALDATNGRLYLADGAGGATALSFYDLASGTFTSAGTLQGAATGATFHDGGYYYVPFAASELHRVTFAADGTIANEEPVAGFTPPAALEVVDLAFSDGLLYGSTTVRASGSADSAARFFTFDPASGTFTTLTTAGGGAYLQLAFDEAGTLYGTYTDDTVFYEIDPVTGASTRLDFWPQVNFTDLASSYACDAAAAPGGDTTADTAGDTSDDTTRTESAWAGEKFFDGATNGARFFVYALSWAEF